MTEIIQVVNAGDLICDLKAAVTALECQHKMDMEREKMRRKPQKPPPQPMYMMIPLEQKVNEDDSSICEDRQKRARNHRHERDDTNGGSISDFRNKRTSDRRRNACKSENNGPSIRGGVLHSRCGCIHRDGLQDMCPLTECRGHPDCMAKPWAVCPPARYFRSRFPEQYPEPPNPDAITF